MKAGRTPTMEKIKLSKQAIEAIELGLSAGYDIEVRTNRYGVSVATNSKKVTYKENQPEEKVSGK